MKHTIDPTVLFRALKRKFSVTDLNRRQIAIEDRRWEDAFRRVRQKHRKTDRKLA